MLVVPVCVTVEKMLVENIQAREAIATTIIRINIITMTSETACIIIIELIEQK
jgi:hypothetical protein